MQNKSTKIPFNKEPKTLEELIRLLKSRGMIIKNEDFAKELLSKVSYYRLSGYWFKYQNKSKSDISTDIEKFYQQITFENIADIYKFDSKLRSLCFDALEKIEVSINTVICEYMCNKYGAYWFLDKNNIETIKYSRKKEDGIIEETTVFSHDKLIECIEKDIKKNDKAPFIKSFYSKYSDKFPPYWIVLQLLTFGTISKIYSSLHYEDRKEISKKLNLNEAFLNRNLKALAHIRNICAHYGRLWNTKNSLTPANIKFNKIEQNNIYNYIFHTGTFNNRTIFPVFYTIALFLVNLYPKSKWVYPVSKKIEEYQEKTNNLISFEKMGFPKNWEQLPLIKTLLKNIY